MSLHPDLLQAVGLWLVLLASAAAIVPLPWPTMTAVTPDPVLLAYQALQEAHRLEQAKLALVAQAEAALRRAQQEARPLALAKIAKLEALKRLLDSEYLP